MISSKTKSRMNVRGHKYSSAGKKELGGEQTAGKESGREHGAHEGGYRMFRKKRYTEPGKARLSIL
jgi:hypothetical protein